MEIDEVAETQDNGPKRNTQFQLNFLENLYAGEKYPSHKAMEDYAVSLKLTYKQVWGWFIERRRKEKREKELHCSSKDSFSGRVKAGSMNVTTATNSVSKQYQQSSMGKRGAEAQMNSKRKQLDLPGKNYSTSSSNYQHGGHEDRLQASGRHMKNSMSGIKKINQRKHIFRLQDTLTPDYILKKIFRKDGPPLGVEFDPLPSRAVGNSMGTKQLLPARGGKQVIPARGGKQRALEKKKVTKPPILNSQAQQAQNAPVKKYGMGKGLMTVWHATNPNAKSFPTGVSSIERPPRTCFTSTLSFPHGSLRKKSNRSQYQWLAVKQRMLGKKVPDKRKPVKKRKVECSKDEIQKRICRVECTLAIRGLGSQESGASRVVMDDEELELRDLQAGPNPLTCSAHLATNGRHGCPLCKDLLARFPPQSVKMKHPLGTRPWDSSPQMVKKLFKVLRFLYTHALTVNVCPFTLDEFAQAFHDKDSLLIGKIHVALLKLFLLDAEQELDSGFYPHSAAKDCRYLGFIHFVRHQELDVKLWNRSLNSLTWTEILRQVLVAAGFGSNQNSSGKEIFSKELNLMTKYGLRPGTLKGELFSILSKQGSNGMKVSELAKDFQVVELNLPETVDELENLICSTLSSDITLFEKISRNAYRLRLNPQISKGLEYFQSDTEDSGSVDDEFSNSSSGNDSELDSAIHERRIVRCKDPHKGNSNRLTEYAEIDESHSGEAWVLGLMEGEYSDLCIEEKLNALVALVDLTAAGSSIRMEDPVRAISEHIPAVQYHGSGAKIKKSLVNQHPWPKPTCDHGWHTQRIMQMHASVEGSGSNMHPLLSICLGSDRRYNSYWLFLGPCNGNDPGHRRIYFESSEDGHWEVIDTEEALHALLSILDCRGIREANLFASLENRERYLCQAMADHGTILNERRQPMRSDQSDADITSCDVSSPVSDIDNNLNPLDNKKSLASAGAVVLELGRTGEEKRRSWERLQAFDAWIWNSFYSNLNAVRYSKRSYLDSLAHCESCHDLYWRDEKHCKTCHATFELDFDMEERYTIHVATCKEKEDGDNMFPRHKVLPSQLQCLKAAVHAVEAAMPEGSLVDAWTRSAHKLWAKRLRRTSSMPEFLQVLTDFVGAISEEWLSECNFGQGPSTAVDEILVFFATILQTSSSVALWLVKLDSLIAAHLESAQSERTSGS